MNKEPPVFHVLFDGYSKELGEDTLANCSCSLIIGEKNIIIDTMTAWDSDNILKALLKYNLKPENIHYVICTHGHSDHIGCNYLFEKARHIVGFSISHKNLYFGHDFSSGAEYIINDFIKIIPTPGHTLQDVTVIVNTEKYGTVAVSGDLFEKEEDLTNDEIWKEAGSDSHELQQKNRNLVLKLADWIVPGHGPMFKVEKSETM